MKFNLLLPLFIFVTGCADLEQTPEQLAAHKALEEKASHVIVANSITVSEASQYQELGAVNCSVNTLYSHDCRDELKLKVAGLNGDLLIIESFETTNCNSYSKDQCRVSHGRAYRKLTANKK